MTTTTHSTGTPAGPLVDAILALAAATTPAEVHAARLAAFRTRCGLTGDLPMGTAGNTLLGGHPAHPGRPEPATRRIARLTRTAGGRR